MVTLPWLLIAILSMVSDTAQTTAIATIVSSAFGTLAVIVTQRSSSKNTKETVQITTRADLEQEAFERASGYLKGAMDRQDAEIARQAAEIEELEADVANCKERLRTLEQEKNAQIATLQGELQQTNRDLDAAKKALALKYPDE